MSFFILPLFSSASGWRQHQCVKDNVLESITTYTLFQTAERRPQRLCSFLLRLCRSEERRLFRPVWTSQPEVEKLWWDLWVDNAIEMNVWTSKETKKAPLGSLKIWYFNVDISIMFSSSMLNKTTWERSTDGTMVVKALRLWPQSHL